MIKGNDITRQPLVLVVIIVIGIFFTTDRTPTIAEDTTDPCMKVQQHKLAIIKMARMMRRKFKT